ncbi:helix-turn-helix transcriptional regulator [Pseudorhizobium pelagicum]|uniref:HTH cro/C1-type domain-containing protein n=1 Tax=Pseudorhizobium pelagicum TaxID=1509405 RepID=A0A922TCN5_9HYPH|nr:helix-turn-helix transcriptional regulator [Pseudorhizobium pelagicum]KEQ09333.1 hypothetical protein GV67_01280 [Pseudorhizobium pelagicum]KEQ10846.1 hypothetical protein GV68_00765 [Pseudorhizobium pelagicum]
MSFYSYRDPGAAIEVGKFIAAAIGRSALSMEEVCDLTGVSRGAKLQNLLTGRHYFPLELARPLAKSLDLDPANLIYLVLRQYAPADAVGYVFEAVSQHAIAQLRTEKDVTPQSERVRSKKKKKKK